MDNLRIFSFMSAVFLLLAMMVCSVKQVVEVYKFWKTKDHILRPFRWYSLALWMLVTGSIIFSPPQLAYLYMRAKGMDHHDLRALATLSSSIWRMIISMLLLFLWFVNPKVKD